MFIGRLDRIGYLLGVLYTFVPLVAAILLYAVINFIFGMTGADTGIVNGFRSVTNIVLFIIGATSIFLIIPVSIGIQIRRWHDMDRTGWYVLLNFIPFVGWIPFIFQLFAPGTKGTNTHGEPAAPRGFLPVLFGVRSTASSATTEPPKPGTFGAGAM